MVSNNQEFNDVAGAAKEDAISQPGSNFPHTPFERLQAEPKGSLTLNVECFELTKGPIYTVLSWRVKRLIRPLEGGRIDIPH